MENSFILSEKGKKLLVFANYKYYKAHVATDGKVRWRCIRSKEEGCPAKLHTASIDSNAVINKEGNHNHVEDAQLASPPYVAPSPSISDKRTFSGNQYQRPAKIPHTELKTNQSSPDITIVDCVRRDVLPPQPTEQFGHCQNYQVQATHELHCSLNAVNLQLELTRNENRMLKEMCHQNTITFQKQAKAESDKCLAFTGYLGNVITDLQNNLQEKMKIIQQQNEDANKIRAENEILKAEINSLLGKVEKGEKCLFDLNDALAKRTDEINVISCMKVEYGEKYDSNEEVIIPTDPENCHECRQNKITTEHSLILVENYAKKMDELAELLSNKNRRIHS